MPASTLVRWWPDAVAPAGPMPSPMAVDPPPLARRAAEELQRELRQGLAARAGLDQSGKMFGVLVVADDNGRVGYLRAYSGMLAGSWHADGFAPPLFDWDARQRFWPDGQRALDEFETRIEAATASDPAASLAGRLAAMDAAFNRDMAALVATHRERKAARRARRTGACSDAERIQLNIESQSDREERQRRRRHHEHTRAELSRELEQWQESLRALRGQRAALSANLQRRIHDLYMLATPGGARRPMRSVFDGQEPPGGAGDCAAPKLLQAANLAALRPLALAEFWWGAPPATGGRVEGVFYPPCRGKCGPLLGHFLEGVDVAEAPGLPGMEPPGGPLPILYEDSHVIAVNKPAGLLSVPGRGPLLRDSVSSRLRAAYPEGSGPLLVHRLDLATSGVLLAARSPEAHAALQRQFAERIVDKRYIAWVDGELAAASGRIDLALRLDPEDRPRQVHDPRHGKPAVTHWRTLAVSNARTRVELRPLTGRTHQLRVHASHPAGLDAPIVGDPLYGRPGPRLMLHAEGLRLRHPITGDELELSCPAPF